ncbi:MAG: hypothetical protein MUC68_11000 [Burkholderiaceae bacterium]|nr:hypothetical protein [Burkholderiaceae bacterium]
MRSQTSICGTTATSGEDVSGTRAGSLALPRDASISAPSGSVPVARGVVTAAVAACVGAAGFAVCAGAGGAAASVDAPGAISAASGSAFESPRDVAADAVADVGAAAVAPVPVASPASLLGTAAAGAGPAGAGTAGAGIGDGSVLHAPTATTIAMAAAARRSSAPRPRGVVRQASRVSSRALAHSRVHAQPCSRARADDVGPAKVTSTSTVRSDNQRRARV